MSKLSQAQKTAFAETLRDMIAMKQEYVFLFNRKTGRSYMAMFTGPMKKHFRIVIAHCGSNDTFKKKIGFLECASELMHNCAGITMPTKGFGLYACVIDFVKHNFYDDLEDIKSL